MGIFSIIFPVFAIAILGYVLTAARFFRKTDIDGIGRYVFNLAIPVLLFNAMSTIDLPDQIEWSLFLSYFLGVAVVFTLGNIIGRRWFRFSTTEHGVYGLACAYSNMVLIGIPVISAGLGDEALLPLFLLISVHSAIMFTSVTLVAESDLGGPSRLGQTLRQASQKIIRNPIIGGLILGIIANRIGLVLPEVVSHTIQLIRGSALPCALFMMGASLTEYKITGHLKEAAVAVVLKMIVKPAIVFLLGNFVFGLSPLWLTVAVIVASLPSGVNTAVFAHKYQAAVAPVSTAVLLSTMLSVGTLTLLLSWFL